MDDRASIVLIGFDTENTSEKIRNTCIMLGKDVVYLATNPGLRMSGELLDISLTAAL